MSVGKFTTIFQECICYFQRFADLMGTMLLFQILQAIQEEKNCCTFIRKLFLNPIRTRGCFPPGSRFFANNFGSNKATQSKLGDFS